MGRILDAPAASFKVGYESPSQCFLSDSQAGNHSILIDALVARYGLDDSVEGTYSEAAMIWNCHSLMRWVLGF